MVFTCVMVRACVCDVQRWLRVLSRRWCVDWLVVVGTVGTVAGFVVSGRRVGWFLAAGGVAFVVDVGLFNVLLLVGWFGEHPVSAKVVSGCVAVAVSYVGNRWLTFAAPFSWRQVGRFVVVNAAGVVVAAGCVWVSRYVCGFTSVVADNVAGNVVGVAAGMVVRYVGYSLWVFADRSPTSQPHS